MKATCPVCGNYGPLENFLAQEDYKKALAVITGLPGDLPRLAVRYLAMFRKPGSDRALTGPRALKIVEGLRDLATAKEIQWKGNRVHVNSSKYWEQAVQTILDRDDQGRIERPLDGHNYLRAVAYELADKAFESAHREKEAHCSYRPDRSRKQKTEDRGQKESDQVDSENDREQVRNVALHYIQKWREQNVSQSESG